MRILLISLIILMNACTSRQGKQPQSQQLATASPDSLLTSLWEITELSNEFSIHANVTRYCRNNINSSDSCVAILVIHDKTTNAASLDTIAITSVAYFDDTFRDVKKIRSYSTKFNAGAEVVDNYYGDIIVADLNFDKKDDIIVINDMGGNGGTFYNYYLQDSSRKFILSSYLTDSMTYFPMRINRTNNTLTTYVRAFACHMSKHIYKFSSPNNYTQLSHKLIDVCKEKK